VRQLWCLSLYTRDFCLTTSRIRPSLPAIHLGNLQVCWNRRSCGSCHKVKESNEYRQGYRGSTVEPERPRRDCQGKGKEDGGCEKGLLRWKGVNVFLYSTVSKFGARVLAPRCVKLHRLSGWSSLRIRRQSLRARGKIPRRLVNPNLVTLT
jgi:hypothetical protein